MNINEYIQNVRMALGSNRSTWFPVMTLPAKAGSPLRRDDGDMMDMEYQADKLIVGLKV